MCGDNFVTNTYPCLLAISWSHNWLDSCDFCVAWIQLTCSIHCTLIGVTLAITFDVGVLRYTHRGLSWGPWNFANWVVANVHKPHAGPNCTLVEVNMWAPRGNLLLGSMDPIIGNSCVAHESAPHWPFMGPMGLCYLGNLSKNDNESVTSLNQRDNSSRW